MPAENGRHVTGLQQPCEPGTAGSHTSGAVIFPSPQDGGREVDVDELLELELDGLVCVVAVVGVIVLVLDDVVPPGWVLLVDPPSVVLEDPTVLLVVVVGAADVVVLPTSVVVVFVVELVEDVLLELVVGIVVDVVVVIDVASDVHCENSDVPPSPVTRALTNQPVVMVPTES